jgi:hypothetical protein
MVLGCFGIEYFGVTMGDEKSPKCHFLHITDDVSD